MADGTTRRERSGAPSVILAAVGQVADPKVAILGFTAALSVGAALAVTRIDAAPFALGAMPATELEEATAPAGVTSEQVSGLGNRADVEHDPVSVSGRGHPAASMRAIPGRWARLS